MEGGGEGEGELWAGASWGGFGCPAIFARCIDGLRGCLSGGGRGLIKGGMQGGCVYLCALCVGLIKVVGLNRFCVQGESGVDSVWIEREGREEGCSAVHCSALQWCVS